MRTPADKKSTLGAALLTDGVGRRGAGILVHQFQELPGFPVTAIVFLSIMALCTAAIGFVEMILVVITASCTMLAMVGRVISRGEGRARTHHAPDTTR